VPKYRTVVIAPIVAKTTVFSLASLSAEALCA
jgi:hypothetical protein